MTREELKAHCERQIEQCEFWAQGDNEKLNNSKIYQEHKLILELLEQEPCWIPVSERLPKPQKSDDDDDCSDWVQVTLHFGEDNDVVCCAHYCFSDKEWYTDTFVLGEVTAWQPLPEPYKEVNE